MSLTVYLRSPRESMCGWVHLPRYIDKIRLHLAGLLPPEYEELLGDQSDRRWLEAAGVRHEQMTDVVRGTLTDGQVCEWVRLNVRRTDEEKVRAADAILRYPLPGDQAGRERFEQRKREYGLAARDDIRTRADLIDADEGRIP
jgi:Domain of unknown function (DUF5069)